MSDSIRKLYMLSTYANTTGDIVSMDLFGWKVAGRGDSLLLRTLLKRREK